jgi:FkbM family methyltransferase
MNQSFWYVQRRIRNLRKIVSIRDAIALGFTDQKTGPISVHLSTSGREVVLRCGTSDLRCMEKIFILQEYLAPYPTEPEIIVDAGANIGMATLFYAQKYPKAKILSIEPEDSNFEILKQNCGNLPNVSLMQAAVWNAESKLVIHDSNAEKWCFNVLESPAGEPASSPQVMAVTIPKIMQQLGVDHIDLLKLDIEGAEQELFKTGTESWLPHVRQIVIELHDRFRPGCAQIFYAAIGQRVFTQEIQGENIFIRFED